MFAKPAACRIDLLAALVLVVSQLGACGEKKTPVGRNLLTNPSFEEVDGDVPKGWKINNFRGLEDEKEATYLVDDSLAFDGQRSFGFKADADTKRFYMLSQEVKVHDVKRVHLRGRIKSVGVRKARGQYRQANFALTFFDKWHGRFNSARFADAGTKAESGTTRGWAQVDRVFRLPRGTEFVVVHCVLGMEGEVWFDDLSLDVPEGLPWRKVEGEIFTHYWLDENGYPEGAIEYQRQLYDSYAERLGIPEEDRVKISYYLYPDTATIREALGIVGHEHVDFNRREIHSVDPVDDHEIIHLLTDAYGSLPLILGEGTAFFLLNDYKGEPIHPLAQKLLLENRLPPLETIIAPGVTRLNSDETIPAGASFVGYLLEFGGTGRFLDLLGRSQKLDNYAAFSKTFGEVYGRPLAEAEGHWREMLSRADFTRAVESDQAP